MYYKYISKISILYVRKEFINSMIQKNVNWSKSQMKWLMKSIRESDIAWYNN